MRIPQVRIVDQESWATISKTFTDYNYEQSFEYATRMAARAGASALFLMVHCEERLLAAASVRLKTFPLLGRGLAYISAGPMVQHRGCVWDVALIEAVLAALKRKLVDEEGHFLCLRLPVSPLIPEEKACAIFTKLGFHATNWVRSYRTIISNIDASDRVLLSNFNSKWRTDLNFAQRAGLSIEQGSTEPIFRRFLKLFSQMRAAKDFAIDLYPEFFFSLPPQSIGLEVLIAMKDGEDVAGHVLSLLGNTAVYLFGATNDMGRATKAGYLLNWKAMLLARDRGFGWYDLGGIDPRTNPGVYRFKKRTGGQELMAIGPYEARPSGCLPILIEKLLTLRARLKPKP